MKDRIKAIEEYLKYFPGDTTAYNNLRLCQYADILDIKLNLNGSYFPRYSGLFHVNDQICAGKRYDLGNSKTKYRQNGEDNIVIWKEPRGRLAFVRDKYWWDVQEEWDWLMDVLKSYNPLDYDDINDIYLYDVENGKRLIKDYDEIVKDFNKKINQKVKEVDLARKKEELKRLQAELELEDSE